MNKRGYTLIEMIMVIVIIGILVSVAARSLNNTSDNQRFNQTTEEMGTIARAIAGDERLISGGARTDFGYIGDIGALPPDLDALVANPGGYLTWRGSYLRRGFVEDVDGYKMDAWNQPYIYSGGVTVGSNGGGSPVTKQFANSTVELLLNTVTGFVRDSNGAPPGDSASNVAITLYYPDGAGSITSSAISPSRAGEFSFSDIIPIGLHRIMAIVSGVADTASKYVVVNPGAITLTELRFTSSLWSSGGGGSGSGWIRYVPGSAVVSGPGNRNLELNIENAGTFPVTVNYVILNFTSIPASYYLRVVWGGSNVYNNPRLGSGQTAVFSSPQILDPSQTITVAFDSFKDSPGGGGSFVDMSGISFEIVFSNGDSFNFVTP
ncbi:MAG: prepilin-type N-terminal cleavage/methylation domain-containing protein [candidate division Zixibacteria bacterium]